MTIASIVSKSALRFAPVATACLVACAEDPGGVDERHGDEAVAEVAQAVIPGASIVRSMSSITLAPYGDGGVTAPCPGGSRIVGGGFSFNSNNLRIHSSRPVVSSNGWHVYADNLNGYNETVSAYAQCISGANAVPNSAWAARTFNPGEFSCVTATCPGGQILSGGGWEPAGGMNFAVTHSMSFSNGWRVCGKSNSSVAQVVNGYAVCLSNVNGSYAQYASSAMPVGAYSWMLMDATCPSGWLKSNGGFALGQLAQLRPIWSFQPANTPQTWEVLVYNTSTTVQYMTAYATCLNLSP